jgi:hypothetical protein
MNKGTRNTGGGMSPEKNLPVYFVHHTSDMDGQINIYGKELWVKLFIY